MASLDLADTLTIRPSTRLSLSCSDPALSSGEDNLVMKAARLLAARPGRPLGASLRLQKAVPMAAGLGGGSSDAAAALKGLNQFWKLGHSGAKLRAWAATLGSDVPFCLSGALALATGRGEKLRPVKKVDLSRFWVVLTKPDISVSTRWVYENYVRTSKNRTNWTEKLVKSLQNGKFHDAAKFCRNDLESVTEKKYPLITRLKSTMIKKGAVVSLMSGSGPTVWGIFEDKKIAHKAAIECKKIAIFSKICKFLN